MIFPVASFVYEATVLSLSPRREVLFAGFRTGKQQSLETSDRQTALRLLEIKRQTVADPAYSRFVLKSCLATRDPLLPNRTWQTVMDEMQTHGKEISRTRCARAMKSRAFNGIRHVKLIETTAEDFLAILRNAKVSVAHYLKRLHNLALGLAHQEAINRLMFAGRPDR